MPGERGDRIDIREGGGETRREVYVRYYEILSIYRDDLGYETTSFGKMSRERPFLKSASIEAHSFRGKAGDLEFYFRTGFLHI